MPTIVVSGGFDPIHIGHIRMFQEAALHGDLIVLLNTDEWLMRKKQFIFMPWAERAEIIRSITGVSQVLPAEDTDGTVVASLEKLMPTIFANGGDRTNETTPEIEACNRLGIGMMFNVGGGKIQSSSDLVRAAHAG